jgi:hypothetical protein
MGAPAPDRTTRDHGRRPRTPSSAPPRAHRDRPPSSPGGRGPTLGLRRTRSLQASGRHQAHLRRCTSDRRPTSLHDGSRLDHRRLLPRGQRADPPGRRRRVRRCGPAGRIRRRGEHQVLPVPARDAVVPGSLTGSPWPRRRCQAGTESSRRPGRGPVRLPGRGDAGRRRPDRGRRTGGRPLVHLQRRTAGASPEAHGKRPPRLFVRPDPFRNPVRAPGDHAGNAGAHQIARRRGRTDP